MLGVLMVRRVHRGFGAWTLAQVVALAGVALSTARGSVPDALSVVGGNVLLVVGWRLVLEGFVRFHGLPRRIPPWVDGLVIALLGGFLAATLDAPVNGRVVAVEAVSAFFLLRAALEPLASPETSRSPAQRALSTLWLLSGVASIARAGWAASAPPYQHLWQEGGTLVASVLLAGGINSAAAFLVLYLHFERSEDQLKAALSEVKTLSGLLPICASCKNVRDDRGYWKRIEAYLATHSDLEFSHGICPACYARLYPEGHEP